MVKFGGKIGTLYQMLKNAFKKHPLQNRTNVQTKGRGVKGHLNNVKKNCTFLIRGFPYCENEYGIFGLRGELATYIVHECLIDIGMFGWWIDWRFHIDDWR